jgi:hypothetical protein
MRDYLKLMEIEEVLERCDISVCDIEEIMVECRKEAQTCLCFAHCDSECVCGAWDLE